MAILAQAATFKFPTLPPGLKGGGTDGYPPFPSFTFCVDLLCSGAAVRNDWRFSSYRVKEALSLEGGRVCIHK